MALDRLQKIIARAGVASRREAEEMILSGRVTLNGRVVRELGTKADGARDHVKVDGKLITRAEEPRYLLFFKPKEVMTTLDDPEGRTTILKYLRGVRERVFPVGRLDYHSEGLLVLTNDGDLAFRLSHPSHETPKTYQVKVRGIPSQPMIEKLERGITLEGRRTLPAEISRIRTTGKGEEGNSWWEVKLREGRTQQIRRMFQAIGHPVSKLRRVAIGALRDATLQPGEWRDLTAREIRLLGEVPEPKKKPAARRTATAKKRPPSPKKQAVTKAAAKGSASRRPAKKKAAASPPRSRASRRG